MNPLVEGLTQDYILLGIEMIQLPVTASHTRELLVGLYYAKESKRILEPNEAHFIIPIVNEYHGTFAYGEIANSDEFTKEKFTELIKTVSKNTDGDIEDAAFNFYSTINSISYAYDAFETKIKEIKELTEQYPEFIYDYAMIDWHKRKYLLVHLPDTVLDFKYEAGALSIYDNNTKAYVFTDRCHLTDFLFNTEYIKNNLYSTSFDLRAYKTGIRDFLRFQYAAVELLIQPRIKFASSHSSFTETFNINSKEAITFTLDKDYTNFYKNLYFNNKEVEDSYKLKTLTIIDNIDKDTEITHDVYHTDLISTGYEDAKYSLKKFGKKKEDLPVDDEFGDDDIPTPPPVEDLDDPVDDEF